MKNSCHVAKASRLRGEDGGQGDGAKLQDVAWAIFGDGLAMEGNEKGESRTAAREEEVPCTESQKMARAKIMRLEQGRLHPLP